MSTAVLPVRGLECRMAELGDKAVCACACMWRVVTNRKEMLVHVICNKDQKSRGGGEELSKIRFFE